MPIIELAIDPDDDYTCYKEFSMSDPDGAAIESEAERKHRIEVSLYMARYCLEKAYASRGNAQKEWIWADHAVTNAAHAGIELAAGNGRCADLESMSKQLDSRESNEAIGIGKRQEAADRKKKKQEGDRG